jgi:ABC-type glycerol-3-phosphate transport system substrate-binding protein
MTQTENQMRWAEDTKLFPVTASALDLAATSSAFPKQYQQAVGLVANSYGYPQNPGWAMIKNLLADGTYQFNKMYPYITAVDLLKSIDSQAVDIIK